MTTSTILHAGGTVTRSGICEGCSQPFRIDANTHIQQRYCTPKCRLHHRIRHPSKSFQAAPVTLPAQDFSGPRKEAWQYCCLLCGRTQGEYWLTAAEAQQRTATSFPQRAYCLGALLLEWSRRVA